MLSGEVCTLILTRGMFLLGVSWLSVDLIRQDLAI